MFPAVLFIALAAVACFGLGWLLHYEASRIDERKAS